ncbi:hypothetical protein JOC55_004843 [Paenibacillus sacheonensis]|nr:hypothetical protein [Paenibacillus sacheonensis]
MKTKHCGSEYDRRCDAARMAKKQAEAKAFGFIGDSNRIGKRKVWYTQKAPSEWVSFILKDVKISNPP